MAVLRSGQELQSRSISVLTFHVSKFISGNCFYFFSASFDRDFSDSMIAAGATTFQIGTRICLDHLSQSSPWLSGESSTSLKRAAFVSLNATESEKLLVQKRPPGIWSYPQNRQCVGLKQSPAPSDWIGNRNYEIGVHNYCFIEIFQKITPYIRTYKVISFAFYNIRIE